MKISNIKSISFILLSIILLMMPFISMAESKNITCEINVAKTKNWNNYDVKIHIYNLRDNKLIYTFDLSKADGKKPAKDSLSKSFDCTKITDIKYSAQFSPAIWENEKDKLYSGKKVLNITDQVYYPQKGANKIIININFPQDFLNIPEVIIGQ